MQYEFGGPVGTLGIMVGLPGVVLFLYLACNGSVCLLASGAPGGLAEQLDAVLAQTASVTWWSWDAIGVVGAWTLAQMVLYVGLPGPVVEGVVLRDKTRLRYPMNGHLAFWLSLAAVIHLLPLLGGNLSWIYDNYLQLATASMGLSLALSAVSYLSSFAPDCLLADGGDSGNPIYDFFIGRPLNPRVGLLDLKACCELRPGLIGWVVLNLGCAAKQLQTTGAVSAPMVAINAFQMLYVWDALYNEQATTPKLHARK